MSTFTNLLFHIVYSTKYRKALISAVWQDELYGYIGGIFRENNATLIKIGGIADHVHILAKLSPTIAISDVLRLVKTNSSKWINERSDVHFKFQWQPGFSAFSVSESQVPAVVSYIANQAEHHRTRTFEEEFLGMLRKHRIEFDPRYVFEREIVK
jgi:REP element-mobilizing transposase RayT